MTVDQDPLVGPIALSKPFAFRYKVSFFIARNLLNIADIYAIVGDLKAKKYV